MRTQNRKLQKRKGIATLELLIAFSFLALAMTGAVLVSFGGQTINLDVNLTQKGFSHTASSFEKNVAASIAGWDALASANETEDVYTLSRDASFTSPCMKLVDTNSSWVSEKNRGQGITLATLAGNKEIARALGGGCSRIPPGGWDNPDTAGSVDISPNGIKGTGVDIASIHGTRYAFLATEHSNPASDDLFIIDVSDFTSPVTISSINTGVGSNDVEVVGSYAYVLQNDTTNQLQVIDVDDPENPVLVDEISLAAYGVSVAGSDPEGWRIAYYDGYIYVGLRSTIGPEFLIFDVSTPSAPVFVGAIDSAFNHNVNGIAISSDGNYAFLATGYDDRELMVIDISDKSSPVDTGLGFDANEVVGDTEDATSIYLVGDSLYLGRERVANANKKNFYIFDVTTPTAPNPLGSKRIVLNPNTQIEGIAVAGPYAFLATTDSTKGFQLWQIDNPSNIMQPSACSNYNYSEKSRGIIYADNLVFMANESNAALRIIYDQPSVCTP